MKSRLRGMLARGGVLTPKPGSGGPWRTAALGVLWTSYLVLWMGGVLSHLLRGGTPQDQNWAASLFLLLAGLIVLVRSSSMADVVRLLLIALAGLTVEAVGVRYGVPFGAYAYTEVLRPKLSGVPLVMGCAWMVLVAYLKEALRALSLNAWARALLASAWMTGLDLVIDPLAANQLGYWRWAARGAYYGIPASNFAGWFIVSFTVFSIWRREWRANYWAGAVGLSILLFFTLIGLAQGLFVASGIGVALCLLDLSIRLWPARPAAARRSRDERNQELRGGEENNFGPEIARRGGRADYTNLRAASRLRGQVRAFKFSRKLRRW